MAAKTQHVHDSCVVERRLRPIYDWLDVGNNKKALQEIEKVLKKSPTLQCARALKCLASLRLGREQEALTQLDTLAEETPSDDATLQVMTICYRESQQLEKVCRVYEAAVRADPTSEELHTHLFMAHVRVGALERQQQAAMQLYRLKPKNPYYFWAVMSIVLQATRGVGLEDKVKRGVLLSLAQRMVERLVNEGRLEAEQEMQLYLLVLQLQGQHERALEVLGGPLAAHLMPGAMPQAALPLLHLLQHWPRLNTLSKQLLWENPDRWDFYQHYFYSSFQLMRATECAENNCEGEPLERPDDSPERCKDFVCQLIHKAGGKLRGPYLARLEFYRKLQEENIDAEALLGSAEELLVQYLMQFGQKACSVSDLRPYLRLLPVERQPSLSPSFFPCTKLAPDQVPTDEDSMQRHISWLQLSRCCGAPPAAVILLRALRPPRAVPPLPTERAPSDPYCLLLAHHCWDMARQQGSSRPLLQALRVMHDTLDRSPSNAHCKLLAMKLYHVIGCGTGAQEMYESLEVKHVQLDSLGHLHCARLSTTGLLHLAKDACEATVKFFVQNYKDSVDHLTFSYKFGSFMKLEELMEFRERLQHSLHHAACLVERCFLLLLSAPSLGQACKVLALTPPPPNWDQLRDNQDLTVQINWDPITSEDEKLPEKLFHQEISFLKIRTLMLRCLVSCQDVANTKTDKSEKVLELERLSTELEELLKSVREEKHEALCTTRVAAPLPSRLIGFINSPLPLSETYLRCFQCLIGVARGATQEPVEECCKWLRECHAKTLSCLDAQKTSDDPIWTCRETLESVVNYVEVISVACLVAGFCSELLTCRSSRSKGGRRGGGGVGGSAPPALVSCLTQCCEEAASSVTSWQIIFSAGDLVEEFAKLWDPAEFPEGPIACHIKESHTKSTTTIAQTLKDKIKFLSFSH